MTTKTTQQDAARASYLRARTLVDRLVDQVPTLPNAAEAHRSFALDSYEARLHFGVGLDAGRGVLETATLVDTEPVREAKHNGKGALIAYWIGLRTVVDGVPLSAWALTNEADADTLLPPAEDTNAAESPETTATQPIPTVSADPAAVVAPAITPVPLAAMTTAASETRA
ncbi:hypothetical protein AB0E99_22635 [Streptomyces sp. NPDC030592]|uniref:hypothetical protein n=1 Tax=Streptomyces sp. NPDC030592 TaxID=3155365 RepID=UPI0033F7B666